jgi:hypothetical protein
MSRYKYTGIFLKQRTEKKWVVVFKGDECLFHKKSLALLSFRRTRKSFPDARILEQTTVFFQSPAGLTRSIGDPFRIDITRSVELHKQYKAIRK